MQLRAHSEEFLDGYHKENLPRGATARNMSIELSSADRKEYIKKARVINANSKLGNLNGFGTRLHHFQSNTDLSTSTDIPCLVNRLQSTNPAIQAVASACIQHVVYRNDDAKEEAWRSGALSRLIKLLFSDDPSVVANSTGALRNLTSGSNVQLCFEFEQFNGLSAIIWLMDQYQKGPLECEPENSEKIEIPTGCIQKALENASAILSNISSLEAMRNKVMAEIIVPVLVSAVLIPVAEDTVRNIDKYSADNPPPYSSVLYRNCTAVIRNMSCSKDAAIRTELRRCSGLLVSLFLVMRMAADSGLADMKAVENCVCAVRNLAYSLGEINSNTDSGYRPLTSRLFDLTFGVQSQSRPAEEINHREWDAGGTGVTSVESVLWQPDAVATLLLLLRRASNPVCIEAAAGAIQNLTASKKWPPAAAVRSEVRLQQGLSILVDLLRFCDGAAAVTLVATLQNLIFEKKTLIELGRCSLPTFVACLTCESNMSHSRSLSSLASFAASTTASHISPQANWPILLPILRLCSKIILSQDSFTSHFVELGGVHCLSRLVHLLSPDRDSAQQNIRGACYQAAIQLLRALWKIKRLHSFYSEYGLSEADFIQKRSGLLSQKSRPRSSSRSVPMSLDQRYASVQNWKWDRYHQAHRMQSNGNQWENFQRAPSAASSSVYQLSLFSNRTRGRSVDALMRERDHPFDSRVAFSAVDSTLHRNCIPLAMTPRDDSSNEISDDGNETDAIMTLIPASLQRDFKSMGNISGLKSRQINQKSTKMRSTQTWKERNQIMDSQDKKSDDHNESTNLNNLQSTAELLDVHKNAAPALPPRNRSSLRNLLHNRQASYSPVMMR